MANEGAGGRTRSSSAAETTAAAQRATLKTLRRPVSKLTVRVAVSATASLKRAGDAASKMILGVRAISRKAVEGIRKVKDNHPGAIDASPEKRPYPTPAMSFALRLLIARLRRGC